jgi:hypothetical protein
MAVVVGLNGTDPLNESDPKVVAAGMNVNLSARALPAVLPVAGLRLAWMVHACPDVTPEPSVHPFELPAVTVKSVESVCAKPVAAVLPTFETVPPKLVRMLEPKLKDTASRITSVMLLLLVSAL